MTDLDEDEVSNYGKMAWYGAAAAAFVVPPVGCAAVGYMMVRDYDDGRGIFADTD